MADLRIARILIVETDHRTSCNLANILADAGFDPWGTALAADMAVSLARSFRPDLAIVADHLCDGSDGIEVARRISYATSARILMSVEHSAAPLRLLDHLGLVRKPHVAGDVVRAISLALTAMAAEPVFDEATIRVASSHARILH